MDVKRRYLDNTALVGLGTGIGICGCLGVIPSTAAAADKIKLSLGGYFDTAIQANFETRNRHPNGDKRYTSGIFSDSEIYFSGETTLDNGLTVGTMVQLEGEESPDQIDEAYIYFSGGFGKIEIGSNDEALQEMCVTPPGASANFGGMSPDQVGTNVFAAIGASSNSICSGVDAFGGQDTGGDAQKILYFSPVFDGFQLSLSYTPHAAYESTGVTGAHSGMPQKIAGSSSNNFSAYGTYNYSGDDWSISWGAGASFETAFRKDTANNLSARSSMYQTALNLSFGNLSAGVAAEYYDDYLQFQGQDAWVIGAGLAYTIDAWTLGLQYSHGNYDHLDSSGATPKLTGSDKIDRIVATTQYDLGSGVTIDGEIGYTWLHAVDAAVDHASSVEIGLGTAISF
jgi:predicted porin